MAYTRRGGRSSSRKWGAEKRAKRYKATSRGVLAAIIGKSRRTTRGAGWGFRPSRFMRGDR